MMPMSAPHEVWGGAVRSLSGGVGSSEEAGTGAAICGSAGAASEAGAGATTRGCAGAGVGEVGGN